MTDRCRQSLPPGGRSYQLTHDYLVHSLRDWLTRKQRETRKGRAELILEERAKAWTSKPENRYLPSARESFTIRLWTLPERLERDTQRRMMKRATLTHGAWFAGVLAIIVLLSGAFVTYSTLSRMNFLLSSLRRFDAAEIPGVLVQLAEYPRWIYAGRLRKLAARSESDPRSPLGYSLALLPDDHRQLDYLYTRLTTAAPAEMAVIRDTLKPLRRELTDRLWNELQNAALKAPEFFPPASVLADYDQTSARWLELAPKVANAMALATLSDWEDWSNELFSVRAMIAGPMIAIYRDKSRPEDEHMIATEILARYVTDQPGRLVDLLLDAEPKSYAILFPVVERNMPAVLPDLRNGVRAQFLIEPPVAAKGSKGVPGDGAVVLREQEQAKAGYSSRRARAAVALIRLGSGSEVWHLLEHCKNPDDRTAFIAAINSLGVDLSLLVQEFERLVQNNSWGQERWKNNDYLFDPVTSERRAIIMILAGTPAGVDCP